MAELSFSAFQQHTYTQRQEGYHGALSKMEMQRLRPFGDVLNSNRSRFQPVIAL